MYGISKLDYELRYRTNGPRLLQYDKLPGYHQSRKTPGNSFLIQITDDRLTADVLHLTKTAGVSRQIYLRVMC